MTSVSHLSLEEAASQRQESGEKPNETVENHELDIKNAQSILLIDSRSLQS